VLKRILEPKSRGKGRAGGIAQGILRNVITCRPTDSHLLLMSSNQGVWSGQSVKEMRNKQKILFEKRRGEHNFKIYVLMGLQS
jgi:hypothetical protein